MTVTAHNAKILKNFFFLLLIKFIIITLPFRNFLFLF